jgi:hypothetical protein
MFFSAFRVIGGTILLFASAENVWPAAMPVPVINLAQMREWEAATWATGQTEAESHPPRRQTPRPPRPALTCYMSRLEWNGRKNGSLYSRSGM